MATCIYLVTPIATQFLVDQYIDELTPCLGIDAGIVKIVDKRNCLGAIGDFDTLKDTSVLDKINNVIRLNPIKDDTDTKAAIDYAYSLGYSKIIILGGFDGERIDHSFANFALLNQYALIFIDQNSCVEVIEDRFDCYQEGYDYFSLFALQESVISITNAKYPLSYYTLKVHDPLCVSNTWINQYHATINVHSGRVAIMRIREGKLYEKVSKL